MLKNCRFSKLCRQQRRPGIRADFAVRALPCRSAQTAVGFFRVDERDIIILLLGSFKVERL
jgi:hypothetical protein